MKYKKIIEISKKILIELETKELIKYSNYFKELDKMIKKLKDTKIKNKKMKKNYSFYMKKLSIKELEENQKSYNSERLSRKNIKENSITDEKMFILFKKNKI